MSKIHISTNMKLFIDGETHWEETGKSSTPIVSVASSEKLQDFSKTETSVAEACIYCGSIERERTREHVIAYALGGNVTIPKGSCHSCQKITHKFETAVLRGPMQMVRFINGLPSRTKHHDVPETVQLLVTIDEEEQIIEVPRNEAPILLAFPTFEEPTYLAGTELPIKMNGITTGNFGVPIEDFAMRLKATKIQIISPGNAPAAFAQMVAKTAYANAYVNGQIDRIKNPNALVSAILHKPNTIGKFVGTLSEPYLKREGVIHYLGIHELKEPRVLYSTVQFFASIGAPTYIVVLGDLK
jgi:hypothetical protein